jgi:hypothetical protein
VPYSVRLVNYVPPARDTTAWTVAALYEASAKDGSGETQIETFDLSLAANGGLDATPKQPKPRTFTTELATLAAGWYAIEWRDSTGDTARTGWVYNGANIAPGLDQVFRLVVTRVRDQAGQLDEFPETGRVNRVRVEGWISDGVKRVRSKVGAVPAELADDATHVVALYTAMLVELALIPEQQSTDAGPYDRLKDLFDEALADLVESVEDVGGGSEPGPGDDAVLPVGTFPSPGVRWDCEPL